jgi:predicted RNase H-like HicB family nuclease
MAGGPARVVGMQSLNLTAIFMKVPEGYIAFIEELPGANTQGDNLEKARENLKEAAALVMESNRALAEQAIADQALEESEVIRKLFALPTA